MTTTPWGVYWHILSTLTCILFVLTGCGGSSGESGDAAARMSRLNLALNTTSTTSRTADSGAPRQAQPGDVDFVTRLTVRITATDITPIVARFPVAANQQETVRVEIPSVPTGRQRQIAVTAFNASNMAVFRGTTTRDLLQAVETVALTLTPLTPPRPDNRPPAPTAPDIMAGSTPSSEAGPNMPGTSRIRVNDPDEGQTHTFAVTRDPASGAAVVDSTGLVTYTPAHGFTSAEDFTVTVTDNGTPPLSGQVTITANVRPILPGNRPPAPTAPDIVAGSSPSPEAGPNTPGTSRIRVNDPDEGQRHTFAVTAIARCPCNFTAQGLRELGHPRSDSRCVGNIDDDPSFIRVTTTAQPEHEANLEFDPLDDMTCSRGIEDQPPIERRPLRNREEFLACRADLFAAAAALDISGCPLSSGVPTAHGTAEVDNTGLVMYTPAHGFIGEDSFTVTVTDNGTPPLSGQVTITAEVCSNQLPPPGPDQPPPVIDTDLNTPGFTQIQIVSPRPFDLDADITSPPSNGTAMTSVEGGGTVRVTYTPDADFVGRDSIGVTVTAAFTDGGCPPLQRGVFTVDVTVGLRDVNDVNELIAAIEAANASTGQATVTVPPGLYTLTAVHNITAGANGLPSITANIRLVGSNAATTIIERAPTAPPFRILHVANSSSMEVTGITLRGGNAVAPEMPENLQRGGGLFNEGSARLQDVVVTGNRATSGGGIAVANAAFLEVTDSTIQNNTATLNGGGLFFTLDGTAEFTTSILSSTISGNTAAMNGGGIANATNGFVNLRNSTVSGNQAGQSGGGLHNSPDSVLALVSSTITNNTANSDNDGTGAGGGLAQDLTVESSGASTLLLTIIAGNTVLAGTGPDCAGPVFSHGFNLIRAPGGCTINGSITGNILRQNPLLGPLQQNGGPTETHALLPGSPAIDGGDIEFCGSSDATDQRGESRLVDGDGDDIPVCDLGAYERQSTDAPGLTLTGKKGILQR